MTLRPRRPALLLVGVGVVATAVAFTDPVRRAIDSAWRGGGSEPPADEAMVPPSRPVIDFALAPDGRSLAFTAVEDNGRRRLWLRSYPGATERVVEGSDGAASPFWSRDSAAIAYVAADGMLRRVAASGGPAALIAEAAPVEGAWGGGVILFTPRGADGPLHRISIDVGTAWPVTQLRPGEARHAWPAFLPDGRRFLYTVMFEAGPPAIHLGSLDAMDGREVLANASRAAVADGYLVYLRDGALIVQLFDTDMLIPRSDPIPVDESGVTSFSVSRDGVLAYQQGSPELTLVDWRAAGRR